MAFTQSRRNNIGSTLQLDTGNDKIGIGTTPKTSLTVEGTITLKEQADADADTAAYGQLWVNTATPNELYFTTDAGDDIQLTTGTNIAGGGSGTSNVTNKVLYSNHDINTNLNDVWSQLGSNIDGASSGDLSGHSVSLSADGTIVAIGSPMNYGSAHDKGHVRIFKYDGSSWSQLGSDIDGAASSDDSGWSVSLSADGTIIAISAPDHSGDKGHVRIFKYDGSSWSQLGSDIDGAASSDDSGWSVSLSADGTIIAISAPDHSGDKGHVRIFKYDGSSWSQLGSDIDGASSGDYSGWSVSLSADGTIVAIGAHRHDSDKGHVRIFKYDGSYWSQLGSDIDGASSGDWSGWSVSLSADGTIVAIGAYKHDSNKGHVRIFKYDGSSWSQLGSDIDGASSGDYSGWSVSLSADGTIVAIGAYKHDSNKGHVRIFKYDGSSWSQLGSDIDGASGDYSGHSVSLSTDGTIVAIGSKYYDSRKGRVRIYNFPKEIILPYIYHNLSINNKHFKSFNVTCSSAHSGDNSIIVEVCKIPALSIITNISAIVETLSNLGTYLVNLSLSTSTGTAADGALANASTTITVPELLGAGANNTYQQNSAIAMAGTAADIVLSSGGSTKVVYTNRPNTTIVGTADTFLYVCNAGTGNGTTSASTSGVLNVCIEYIGLD